MRKLRSSIRSVRRSLQFVVGISAVLVACSSSSGGQECTQDSDCGGGFTCATVCGSHSQCYKPCSTDADCAGMTNALCGHYVCSADACYANGQPLCAPDPSCGTGM